VIEPKISGSGRQADMRPAETSARCLAVRASHDYAGLSSFLRVALLTAVQKVEADRAAREQRKLG